MTQKNLGELTQIIDEGLNRPCHLLMRPGMGDDVESFHRIRSDRRVYTAIVTELWEQYVHPPMHECQWELIRDMVASLVSARGVADSVVGGAALILFGKMCQYARAGLIKLRGEPHHHRRSSDDGQGPPGSLEESFAEMASDCEKLARFLAKHAPTRIGDIAEATGIERERVYPLLKLAGMQHVVRGPDRCCWSDPSSPQLPLDGHSDS